MIQPEDICQRDPVARLLLWLSGKRVIRMIGLAIAINAILSIGLGGWLTVAFPVHDMLSPFQSKTVFIEVFIYCIFLPSVWIFFTWEPLGILHIFQNLEKNHVLENGQGSMRYATIEEFLKAEHVDFNRWSYFIIALASTICFFIIWWLATFTPQNPFWFNHRTVWWQHDPWYFWIVWVPLVYVNWYMTTWIIIRRLVTSHLIGKLLNSFRIVPRLFHPDRANGLSPIGNYPLRFAPLVTLVGIWVFLVIAYPVFFGEAINLKFDTLLYLAIYIFFIYAGLIGPVWKAHVFMKNAKQQMLESLAEQIRSLLAITQPVSDQRAVSLLEHTQQQAYQPKEMIELVELIEALERKYRMVERELHPWPFNTLSLSEFLISTGIPLASTILTVIASFTIVK